MRFQRFFVLYASAAIVLLLSSGLAPNRKGERVRTRVESVRQVPVQMARLPILDEYGQRLDGVFAGLSPHSRIAADNTILNPGGTKPCVQSARRWGPVERIASWAAPALVYASGCPSCFEPGNCTGYHFRCLSVECFPGCGGYRNWCYSDPGWSPAWRGYCISNTTACPQCPECLEQTCYHG
jgi:hypothetical protein